MDVAVQIQPKNWNAAITATDDYSLVNAAVNGNQKAFEMLMNRYRSAIYYKMLKMANNRDDADDLTLEAFGKAFDKLSSYVPRYAFSTWLFRIAHNNAIDHLRRRRMQFLSIDEPIAHGDSSSDYSNYLTACTLDPEEEIIREQRLGLVRELLQHLSKKYRLMVELRFFEELSYDEIAEELDLPLGTVKAQLFRAKEILANLLEQPGAGAYIEYARQRA